MKKSLAVFLSILLLLSIVGFAFAEDSAAGTVSLSTTTNGSGSVNTTTNATVSGDANTPVTTSDNTTTNTINKTNYTAIREKTAHPSIAPNIAESERDHIENQSGEENHEVKPLPYAVRHENQEEIKWIKSISLSNELQCRISFNIGVLNSLISASPNSSSDLQPVLAKLQEDLSSIQSMDNTTNVSDFARNYANDMKSINGVVASWKSHEGDSIPLRVRAELVSSYKELSASYNQCQGKAYYNISQQRINEYQSQLNNYQNQSNKLAGKGFNTSSLDQLIQDAQSQIMVPLQAALANANSSAEIKSALGSYCLFDGCVNGTNFHLEAKFNIERLNIVLSDLQANADAFGLDNSTIAQAQQYLSNAQSTLDSVGISVYQNGNGQTISNNIQLASKTIVKLMAQVLKQPIGGLK